jgi:hypothetical protein
MLQGLQNQQVYRDSTLSHLQSQRPRPHVRVFRPLAIVLVNTQVAWFVTPPDPDGSAGLKVVQRQQA